MARQVEDMPTRTFKAGDVIFRQGNRVATGEAYLVQSGTVEVTRRNGKKERVLRTLGKGDLLGEVALFGRGLTRPPRWRSSRSCSWSSRPTGSSGSFAPNPIWRSRSFVNWPAWRHVTVTPPRSTP